MIFGGVVDWEGWEGDEGGERRMGSSILAVERDSMRWITLGGVSTFL